MESNASMDKDDTEVPVYGSMKSIAGEDGVVPSSESVDEPEPEMPVSNEGEEEMPAPVEGEEEPEPEAEPEQEPEAEPEQEPEAEPEQESEPEAESMEEEQQSETSSAPVSNSKALSVLNKASNFRKKLTTTKRKLPSLDDAHKDKIRNELIAEFGNILKLYKNKTTRKKYIRRLNGLRTVFNQSLNKLNGTTRHRKRKTRVSKSKKSAEEEEPMMEEPMVAEASSPEEESVPVSEGSMEMSNEESVPASA